MIYKRFFKKLKIIQVRTLQESKKDKANYYYYCLSTPTGSKKNIEQLFQNLRLRRSRRIYLKYFSLNSTSNSFNNRVVSSKGFSFL
jgi:hypothetical protein